MHILYDENGNPIAHGDHAQSHGHGHDHHGGHTHGKTDGTDENLAVLTYMYQHNEHHASEREEMAEKLRETGFQDVAEQIHEGVLQFYRANEFLGKALELMRDRKK